jgi:hypothetical protein
MATRFIFVAAALLVTFASCEMQCAKDDDCAPASCCHSTLCVPTSRAPKCQGIACDGCAPFTLDCGGHCGCNAATQQCEGHLANTHGDFFSTKHKKYGYIHTRVRGKPGGHGG